MEAEAKIDRHSAPGSQAGPRRALESLEDEVETDRALRNESLLDGGGAEPSGRLPTMDGWEDSAGGELEYDFGDAVVVDLVGNTSGLSDAVGLGGGGRGGRERERSARGREGG